MPAVPSERAERDLARVVAAATVSNFGSMLTAVALPFVAIDALGAGWLAAAPRLPSA